MPYYPSFNQYQQPQTQQIQQGGFVLVKNEMEAMNYPVALGNSVTFKNESQPYIYVKTLGFSQLDQPVFEKFKLVKEEVYSNNKPQELPTYDFREEIDNIKNEIRELREKIETTEAEG